ncbi:MAG: hypothetical protein JNM52_03410, partial [Betaproteobacteria bacterium]|nr:hypothetical protein [Betaproteobacteria bacterium]
MSSFLGISQGGEDIVGRNFLAVLAGLATTMLVVLMMESIGHFWFAPKTPIDMNDRAAITTTTTLI